MASKRTDRFNSKGTVVGVAPNLFVATRDTLTTPPHAPDWIPVVQPPDNTFRIPRDGDSIKGDKGERGERGERGDKGERGERGTSGADGKSFRHRGLFNPRSEYEPLDVASDGQGSTYICVEANTGRRLTNARFWQVLAARGETGPAGKNETTIIRHGSPRIVQALERLNEIEILLEA